MDLDLFDELTKGWATRISRRQTAKLIGGTAAGVLALLERPDADAKRGRKRHGRKNIAGKDHGSLARNEEPEEKFELVASQGLNPEGNGIHGEATRLSHEYMRAPWSGKPGYAYHTWKVINGYGQGSCHSASGCGGDQTYALDLVPTTGGAGGRAIYAPLRSKVVFAGPDSKNPGIGQLIKLDLLGPGDVPTGYRLHIYHLKDLKVAVGNVISSGKLLGYVFDQYNSNGSTQNHLHVHVSNSSGKSVPFGLGGKLYFTGGTITWKGQLIRNNVLYSGPNFTGDRYAYFVLNSTNLANNIGNDNASSLRVNNDCDIKLYEHTNYGGRTRRFDGAPGGVSGGSFASLGDFDNIASSLSLYSDGGGM